MSNNKKDRLRADCELGTSDWAVFRQDFTGNEFLVERNLTLTAADCLMAELEAHPHHQHYWVDRLPECSKDFPAMLADLIASGSPLKASIDVLRNQKASDRELISAVQIVCDCTAEEARERLK